MPWRISASARTLTVNRFSTPQAFSICTAALEKPHCGNCGVPFMYSTNGWVVTCSRMTSCVFIGGFRGGGRSVDTDCIGMGATPPEFNPDGVKGLFLDRAGEAGDVVFDEKGVKDGARQRPEQCTGHQRAPVVHVSLDR